MYKTPVVIIFQQLVNAIHIILLQFLGSRQKINIHTLLYYRHYTSYIRIQYKLLYGIAEKRTQKERNMINSHLQIRRGTKYTLRSMGSVTQVKPT